MRRLLCRCSRENGSQAIDDEGPLQSTFGQGHVELQRRQQFKRILKFVFFFIMTYLPYSWWKFFYMSTKPQNPNKAILFPLHVRFLFDNVSQSAHHVIPLSPHLKILDWHNVTQSETFYTRVRPLHNIAFFAEMNVGGKISFMLIDTGSELSWLFCEPPVVILKDNPTFVGPHGYFQPSLDKFILYKDFHPRGFYTCYPGGYLCKDIYYLGGLVVNVLMVKETFVMRHIDMSDTSKPLVFGCGHSFRGPIDDIKGGVDGVLGLMPKLFSLPYQLASIHTIRKVIGLCLKRYLNHHLQEVVGYLFFGDEVMLVQEQTNWIKMTTHETTFGFAAAFLKNIQIGTFNHQFGTGCQGEQDAKIIFDTGTTMTYLMPDIYDGLTQYLDKYARHLGYKPLCQDTTKRLLKNGELAERLLESYKMCWYRDINDMNSMWYKDFENLSFTFSNVAGKESPQYQLEPLQYLSAYKVFDIDLKIHIICPWLLKHESKQSKPFNILGGLAFQGHLVVFDIDNKKIGWSTPKDCELLKIQDKTSKPKTSHKIY